MTHLVPFLSHIFQFCFSIKAIYRRSFITDIFLGFIAFGDNNGSWFVRKLCQVLLEQHGEWDLVSMLTEVNYRVATEFTTNIAGDEVYHDRQTVSWVASMLTKQVWI